MSAGAEAAAGQASTSLADRVLAGERRALSRALTLVEDRGDAGRALFAALYPHAGRAHVIGITGAPGAGKSSLVNALTRDLRQRERRVAIVAVDPSSPYTGGAVLGDRIRMRDHSGDPGVWIRSMASRGSLGGLAQATGDVVTVLDAAGFDVVLIETVGAGQVEVDIAREAHTTIVVEAPGLGDEVQAIKAGLLEIADIFVVNKADRDGARQTAAALRMNLDLGHHQLEGWHPPVVLTVATTGEGIPELVEAIAAQRAQLEQTGAWGERTQARLADDFERILHGALLSEFKRRVGPEHYQQVLAEVVARQTDPYAGVDRLLAPFWAQTATEIPR